MITSEQIKTVYKDIATPLQYESWYITLIDECKDIIIETEFTSQWSLIEGYHSLGKRILVESERFKKYDERIDYKSQVAIDLNRSKRTVYYAVQFAREYPDLNLLPESKNTSWHHIVNKYLTNGTEKKTVKKADLYKMIKEIKELLETEYKKAQQRQVEITSAEQPYALTGEYDQAMPIISYIRYLQDQIDKITGGLE